MRHGRQQVGIGDRAAAQRARPVQPLPRRQGAFIGDVVLDVLGAPGLEGYPIAVRRRVRKAHDPIGRLVPYSFSLHWRILSFDLCARDLADDILASLSVQMRKPLVMCFSTAETLRPSRAAISVCESP